MNRSIFAIVATLLSVSMIVSIGCGKGRPAVAEVTGRVTHQGQPLTAGTIVFQPQEGRPAMGEIGPDGRYRLTTFTPGDGAVLGQHRVTIEARRITAAAAPKSMKDEANVSLGAAKVEWLAPEKYSRPETSPLKAEVKSGPNVCDFDLT